MGPARHSKAEAPAIAAYPPGRGDAPGFTFLLFCNWWGGGGCFSAWFYTEEVWVVAEYGRLDVWANGWGHGSEECPECEIEYPYPHPAPEPVDPGGGGGECSIPTDFRQVGAGSDVGGGTLHFEYAWSSSSGNLNDLSACEVGERVYGYSSNPFPSPPFPANLAPNDPTEISVAGTNGGFQDNHSTPGSFVSPFQAASVTASQIYRFRCPCHNSNAWVTLLGPHDIVRSVAENGSGGWKFIISKTGASATIDPLQ